jgi:hypothetical protein
MIRKRQFDAIKQRVQWSEFDFTSIHDYELIFVVFRFYKEHPINSTLGRVQVLRGLTVITFFSLGASLF